MPERRSTFPDGLETDSESPCIDLGGGGSFYRMAERSPSQNVAGLCAVGPLSIRNM